MSKIRFVGADDVEYVSVGTANDGAELDPRIVERLDDYERAGRDMRSAIDVKMYLPGGVDELQMFELRCAAGYEVPAHGHIEDEIIFVLEGSLRFGNRVCPAGSAVFIPRLRPYAFRAGEDGCRFLNIRARADHGSLTPDELAARRRQSNSGYEER